MKPHVTLKLTDEDLDSLISTMIDSGWRDPVPWLDERSEVCLRCILPWEDDNHPFTSRCIGE